MWDLGNFWGEGKSSTPISSYLGVMHEIHVLLVDHDADCLMNTSKMLEMCQYRVSVVEFASAAITMLSNGKVKIDFVLANINSPDLHGFKLLQLAINMSIPIILMSVDDNALMAMRAIENGAYLYIKKPVTIELLKCLWQHVMREKIRARREREAPIYNANAAVRGIEFREVNPNPNPNRLEDRSRKGYYKGMRDDQEYDSDFNTSQGKLRRKVCTEWTQDLHQKFMNAVEQLGEGRCFPKEILDLMNVPGLTRMQVASHLQKCRNDNWRSPDERKSNNSSPSSEGNGSQQKMRRFGSMPRLGRSPSSQGGSKTRCESEMGNDGDVETIVNGGPPPMMLANITADTTNTYTHQQQYEAIVVPHSTNVMNPRHTTSSSAGEQDNYYYYPDMESLIQNYGVPRGISTTMPHPHSTSPAYQFDPVYSHNQNSTAASMDNRSQWTTSDQNSNFGSDHSEARGH